VVDARASAIEAVDNLQDEAVGKLSELIRIPSVNPDYPGVDRLAILGGERTANAYLEVECRRLGLEVDVWEEVAGRSNVVGRWPGAGSGRSLESSGHVGTVSIGKHESKAATFSAGVLTT
jgi:acetylornithine deacetylase